MENDASINESIHKNHSLEANVGTIDNLVKN